MVNDLFIGLKRPKKVYLGTKEVKSIYLGEEMVYPQNFKLKVIVKDNVTKATISESVVSLETMNTLKVIVKDNVTKATISEAVVNVE